MAPFDYDLVIIGGGSGGLTAARSAARLGARVALIDKKRLGGDCLYSGCVPSKSLSQVAKIVKSSRKAARFSRASFPFEVDMGRVSDYIQGVIREVTELERSFVEKVEVLFGKAAFRSPHELELHQLGNGVKKVLTSRNFLIATGSRPAIPGVEGLKEAGFWTNEAVFDLNALPLSLIVVGGGPVGVELAQSFARLGSQVTLIEELDRIINKEEPQVSEVVAEQLKTEGVKILTGSTLERVSIAFGQKILEARGKGQTVEIRGDQILLALGRRPNCEELCLEAAGVEYDLKNGIKVDDLLTTSTSNIFAVGDVTGGYLFTHVAAYEAGLAVNNCLFPVGRKKVDYRVVPRVIFTDPEVGRVGLTEQEARNQGLKVRVTTFPWQEIDRAQADGETGGFIKFILEGRGDKILGAHLVGSGAGELLPEIVLGMNHNLGLNDIMNSIHAYPTLSMGLPQAAFEAFWEARGSRPKKQKAHFPED